MARSDSSKNTGSDSSKKVAKAAKAGATPSASVGRDRRPVGFQMAMFGIVVLGSLLVAFSWQARDAAAFAPTFGDHWHLSYGIYDCTIDGFQGPLIDPQLNHSGIHTHSDGVIHLHPQSSRATGNGATLGTFLEATTAQFDGDDALTFSDRPALSEGVQCGGEDAILQVARFDPITGEFVEVIDENLEDFRFSADQEGVVIALAPVGSEIPGPPAEAVEIADAASPNIFDTFNVDSIEETLGAAGIGFNEDGNLVDAEENEILDADGNPINRATLEQQLPEDDAEGDE